EKVLNVIKNCRKPVVVDFIGGDESAISNAGATPALTLEDAALKATSLVRGEKPKEMEFTISRNEVLSIISSECQSFASSQKYVRGLFSGGSFCNEAMLLMSKNLGKIYSNIATEPEFKLEDPHTSIEHTCIDMGADPFTVGRPHPMIDFSLRKLRLLKEARDPKTAVILLDVVLGYGAHQNPAGELAPIISQAKSLAQREGRYLSIVASICGTIKDPQDFYAQKRKLEDVGVVIMPSNAQAARMAALIAIKSR
ncbi:MAG: FdrA family protein, partial [Halobacteria archaeon]